MKLFIIVQMVVCFNPFLGLSSPESGATATGSTATGSTATGSTADGSTTDNSSIQNTGILPSTVETNVLIGTSASILPVPSTTTKLAPLWPPRSDINIPKTPPTIDNPSAVNTAEPSTPLETFGDVLMWISFISSFATLIPIILRLRISQSKHLLLTLLFQIILILVQVLGIIGIYMDRKSPSLSTNLLLKSCLGISLLLSLWFRLYIISMVSLLIPKVNTKNSMIAYIIAIVLFLTTAIPLFTLSPGLVRRIILNVVSIPRRKYIFIHNLYS
jgi:hypothetical protein